MGLLHWAFCNGSLALRRTWSLTDWSESPGCRFRKAGEHLAAWREMVVLGIRWAYGVHTPAVQPSGHMAEVVAGNTKAKHTRYSGGIFRKPKKPTAVTCVLSLFRGSGRKFKIFFWTFKSLKTIVRSLFRAAVWQVCWAPKFTLELSVIVWEVPIFKSVLSLCIRTV